MSSEQSDLEEAGPAGTGGPTLELDPDRYWGDVLSFRTKPAGPEHPLVSMIRSHFKGEALEEAAKTFRGVLHLQLERNGLASLDGVVKLLAFVTGYLGARLFLDRDPTAGLALLEWGQGAVLDDATRAEAKLRAEPFLAAVSLLHDDWAGPRDTQFVYHRAVEILGDAVAHPCWQRIDAWLSPWADPLEEQLPPDIPSVEAIQLAKQWVDIGRRFGERDRAFKWHPKDGYVENHAGDVRLVFAADRSKVWFSDARRYRVVQMQPQLVNGHGCDDDAIDQWIGRNCYEATQAWLEGPPAPTE